MPPRLRQRKQFLACQPWAVRSGHAHAGSGDQGPAVPPPGVGGDQLQLVSGHNSSVPCWSRNADTDKFDRGGIVGAVIGAMIVVALASFLIKRFTKREAV